MIRDARQLKAKIQQLAKGDSLKSQIYLRNYFMERFLERISVSRYWTRFVLKGGLLIASFVGLDLRSTMDIDSTVRNMSLDLEAGRKIILEIINVHLEDNVDFIISKGSEIMEEHDYPGIRFTLQGRFDGIQQAIRIDLSTGDVITPGAVSYKYKLMFEDRSIHLMTYNLETLIAEKLETMITRGTANTRMRDFYDIYLLTQENDFDLSTLKEAILNTSQKRGTASLLKDYKVIMHDVAESPIMESAWDNFVKQSYFAEGLIWKNVLQACIWLSERVLSEELSHKHKS